MYMILINKRAAVIKVEHQYSFRSATKWISVTALGKGSVRLHHPRRTHRAAPSTHLGTFIRFQSIYNFMTWSLGIILV